MKIHGRIPGRTTSRSVNCALVTLLLFGGACAGNPEPEPLPDDLIGERARVVTDPADLTEPAELIDPPVGLVSLLTADSVVLKTAVGVWQPFSLGPNARLEISRGVTSKAGRGAGIGAIVGGIGVAIIGASECARQNDGSIIVVTPAQCALAGALLGAGTGALVGMVIGSFSKTEQWVEVPAGARR